MSWDVVGFTQYSVDIQKLKSSSSQKKRQSGKDMMQALFFARVVHSLYFWWLQLLFTVGPQLVNYYFAFHFYMQCAESTVEQTESVDEMDDAGEPGDTSF